MAPDPSGSFLRSGVFDKVEPWRKAPKRRTTADEQQQPLVRQGISTNCSPSRRTSPVGLLEPYDARTLYVVGTRGGGRSSAISRKMSANKFLGIFSN